MSDDHELSRRVFLTKLAGLANAALVALLAVPVVGYLVSPLLRSGSKLRWISLGTVESFPEGQTRLATFENPFGVGWDGATDKTACWVRNLGGGEFQVFAINCAHLGCPVRWFPQSGLFMCPCHGGVYYADGSRAAGPPPRGLFEYPWNVVNGKLMIRAGQLPTFSTPA
jgi:quinol---cytochrome c reductase iron-sulfur subunit, bacillus type